MLRSIDQANGGPPPGRVANLVAGVAPHRGEMSRPGSGACSAATGSAVPGGQTVGPQADSGIATRLGLVRVLCIGLVVTGCTAPSREHEGAHRELMEASQGAVAETEAFIPEERSGALRHETGAWLGERVIQERRGEPLPEETAGTPVSLLVAAAQPGRGSRRQLLTEASNLLGLSFASDPLSLRVVQENAAGEGAGSAGTEEETAAELAFLLGGYRHGELTQDFYHEGTSETLLSALADALGFAGWVYEGDRVLLFLYESRDIPVYAMSGGASEEILKEIDAGIRQACGNCTVQLRPELGLCQVTARPVALDRVERYVGDINRRLTRQYVIEVEVISVVHEDRDEFGLDLDLILERENFRLSLGGFRDTDLVGTFGDFVVASPTSPLNNSSVVIDALAKVGRTSVMHASSVVGLDGRSQEVRVERTDKIKIGESVSESEETGNLNVTDVIEEFTDGIVITLKPKGLDHGKLLLRYRLELTTLLVPQPGEDTSNDALRSSVDGRTLENEIVVPVGSRIVFNAFERRRVGSEDSGTLAPNFWLFGGSSTGSDVVETLVVSLRAKRMNPERLLERGV